MSQPELFPIAPSEPDAEKRISLTKGLFALVDAADEPWLSQFPWHAGYARGQVYARRWGERRQMVRMHRAIMGVTGNQVVDHIDGNTLNNQRSNLRICTFEENCRNRKLNVNNKIGLKGVSKDNKRFRATIQFAGLKRHIGSFQTAIEAAKAYDVEARRLFGEFARLNFRDGDHSVS